MKQSLPNLSTLKAETEYLCTICLLAKQIILALNKISVQTSDIFQVIHVDIWNPMRLQTRIRCTVIVTIVDDFSRYIGYFSFKEN